MKKVLKQEFFNRPTLKVAENLLGKYLVRKYRGKNIAAMITEVEVYDGFKDKASHASRGKTERNKIMFGPAGHWYVYFTYGVHWILNIICGKEEYPAAILIRGVRFDGLAPLEIGRRRPVKGAQARPQFLMGPARVTKYFHVDKKLNGKLASKRNGLWIAAPLGRASLRKFGAGRLKIKRTPRIGVQYAGPYWSKIKYRFICSTRDQRNP